MMSVCLLDCDSLTINKLLLIQTETFVENKQSIEVVLQVSIIHRNVIVIVSTIKLTVKEFLSSRFIYC
jgi:hypothetical protein